MLLTRRTQGGGRIEHPRVCLQIRAESTWPPTLALPWCPHSAGTTLWWPPGYKWARGQTVGTKRLDHDPCREPWRDLSCCKAEANKPHAGWKEQCSCRTRFYKTELQPPACARMPKPEASLGCLDTAGRGVSSCWKFRLALELYRQHAL